jgi:hypothetical protein
MVDLNRSDPLFDAQLPIRIRDQRPSKTSSGSGVDSYFQTCFCFTIFILPIVAKQDGEENLQKTNP